MNESKRNAKNKYRAKVEELRVELYPTDEDIKERIAERLAAGEPKATYIKRLIREDIERSKRLEVLCRQFDLPLGLFQG